MRLRGPYITASALADCNRPAFGDAVIAGDTPAAGVWGVALRARLRPQSWEPEGYGTDGHMADH